MSAEECSKRVSVVSAANRPYGMASPRVFLNGLPVEGPDKPAMIGMAENFPRMDGVLAVPTSTREIFSPSRDIKGVWQQGAYGTIGTAWTVQWFPAATGAECDASASGNPPDRESTQTGRGDMDTVPRTRITITADDARDACNSPSRGYTKIGVPTESTPAGDLLRAWGREHVREVVVSSFHRVGESGRQGGGRGGVVERSAGKRHGCRPGQGSRARLERQTAGGADRGPASNLRRADARYVGYEGRSGRRYQERRLRGCLVVHGSANAGHRVRGPEPRGLYGIAGTLACGLVSIKLIGN